MSPDPKVFFRHSPVSISMHIHPLPQLVNSPGASHFFSFTFFVVGVFKMMFKHPYL
ncbi:hypothetical protein Bca4012_072918 [Brassica carinata]